MKITTVVDESREEEIIIYVHKKTELINEIEALVSRNTEELVGYSGDEIIKFSLSDVFCFTLDGGKVYAVFESERLRLKQRLYAVEEKLDSGFVKINQSCIVNVSKIKKFSASFGGALTVELKNGYKDYVSRRQTKLVKERFLKK